MRQTSAVRLASTNPSTMMNLKQALVALIVLPSMGAAFAPSVRTNVVRLNYLDLVSFVPHNWSLSRIHHPLIHPLTMHFISFHFLLIYVPSLIIMQRLAPVGTSSLKVNSFPSLAMPTTHLSMSVSFVLL